MNPEVQACNELNLPVGKKVFFISDIHLGVPDYKSSLDRERRLCAFLRAIAPEAGIIFILGDLFDFWFEYKRSAPAGFTRILGTLADLTDNGIEIHFFRGNHDLWAGDYLGRETGMILHKYPEKWVINGKVFVIGHGDGLGPGDRGYKLLKRIFLFKPFIALFRFLHPDLGISLARFWSGKSRGATAQELYLGDEKEWLLCFCRDYLSKHHADYFVFGHRHLRLDIPVGSARYLNLGEWFHGARCLEFNGNELSWRELT